MKAYVIDQAQLKQYIFIAIASLVLSFVFGYVVGDNQNTVSQETSKKDIDTAATDTPLPQAVKKDADSLTAKTEKKTVQKDPVKAKLEKKKETTKKTSQKNKAVVKQSSTKKSESKPATAEKKKAVVQKKPVVKDVKSTSTKPKAIETAAKAVSSKEKPLQKSTSTAPKSAETTVQDQFDNKRLYSIQAGMFASKQNAESFIEKLAVEKFEAYVSDFVSTSGAVKYNVRVGRFEERTKARERLKEYQKFFSTPAYVVISQ